MYYREPPPTDGESDPAFANQGFSKSAHVKHLKAAHEHAKKAARCLRRALAVLDPEDEMPSRDDNIDPELF